jgi:hypothetical protein
VVSLPTTIRAFAQEAQELKRHSRFVSFSSARHTFPSLVFTYLTFIVVSGDDGAESSEEDELFDTVMLV